MKRFLSLFVLFILFLSGCRPEQKMVPPTEPTTQEVKGSEKRSATVTQGIIVPDKEKKDEIYNIIGEESALDLLKRTHTVEVKNYSFGDIAESIDGIASGKDGRYWIFYVNGKQSEVGAGAYRIKD